MDLKEAMKNPFKYIPRGDYCYENSNNPCPFWDTTDGPEMENGRCLFLNKNDWELNQEMYEKNNYRTTAKRPNGAETIIELTTSEEDGDIVHDIKFSLLWDQVKMCPINMYDGYEDECE